MDRETKKAHEDAVVQTSAWVRRHLASVDVRVFLGGSGGLHGWKFPDEDWRAPSDRKLTVGGVPPALLNDLDFVVESVPTGARSTPPRAPTAWARFCSRFGNELPKAPTRDEGVKAAFAQGTQHLCERAGGIFKFTDYPAAREGMIRCKAKCNFGDKVPTTPSGSPMTPTVSGKWSFFLLEPHVQIEAYLLQAAVPVAQRLDDSSRFWGAWDAEMALSQRRFALPANLAALIKRAGDGTLTTTPEVDKIVRKYAARGFEIVARRDWFV